MMAVKIFIAVVVCVGFLIAGAEATKDTQGAQGHDQSNVLLLGVMLLEGVAGLALLVTYHAWTS